MNLYSNPNRCQASIANVSSDLYIRSRKEKVMFAFVKGAIIEHSARERGGKCMFLLGSASGRWITKC